MTNLTDINGARARFMAENGYITPMELHITKPALEQALNTNGIISNANLASGGTLFGMPIVIEDFISLGEFYICERNFPEKRCKYCGAPYD